MSNSNAVENISGHCHCGGHRGSHLSDFVSITEAVHHDLATLSSQRLGYRMPDSTRRTSDEPSFPLQHDNPPLNRAYPVNADTHYM